MGSPPFLRIAFHDHVRANLFAFDLEWLATDRRHKIPLLVRVSAVHPEDVKLVAVPESRDAVVREVFDDVHMSHSIRELETRFHFECDILNWDKPFKFYTGISGGSMESTTCRSNKFMLYFRVLIFLFLKGVFHVPSKSKNTL
jgi:hypothetical protein